MPAVLKYRYTGGASNSDPDASLGGVMSSEEMAETALNNLFDNASPEETENGVTDYRAIDVLNEGDAEAKSVTMFMKNETTSADTQLDFGIGAGGTPHDGSDQNDTIADEETAPDGVTFDHYTDASRISLPDIPVSEAVRIWIRRTVSAGATNNNNDLGTLAVDYA